MHTLYCLAARIKHNRSPGGRNAYRQPNRRLGCCAALKTELSKTFRVLKGIVLSTSRSQSKRNDAGNALLRLGEKENVALGAHHIQGSAHLLFVFFKQCSPNNIKGHCEKN